MQGRQGTRTLYLWVMLAWAMMAMGATALIIENDFSRVRADFQEQSVQLYKHVELRVETATTVLDGFTTLLASLDNLTIQDERLAHYAERMLDRYPYIYMLEAAIEVAHEDLEHFVDRCCGEDMQAFTIKAFDFQGTQGWIPLESKPVYYPIVFMHPALPEASDVLGLDIGSNPLFLHALEESFRLQRPVASHPFNMVEGGRALLKHSVALSIYPNDGVRYGLLLLRAESLLLPEDEIPEYSLLLYHADYEPDDPRGQLAEHTKGAAVNTERWLLPQLVYERASENPGLPIILRVDRQLQWGDFNLSLLVLLLLGSVLTFLLMLYYARAHHRQELCRLTETDRLFKLANYDSLTGLPNRNLLHDRLQHVQQKARRESVCLAVLFIDLDRFKQVNDVLGHAAGDEVLRGTAERLRRCVRESDTLARLGGDEFVIVLEGSVEEELERVAEKIKAAFVEPFTIHGKAFQLGLSIGIARYPEDDTDFLRLLERADHDMYVDKLRQAAAIEPS